MKLYALHDSDADLQGLYGAREIPRESASELNWLGYGIFWVPNEFTGARRLENLTRIRYWFCELDRGTKDEQRERIRKAPLLPTLVVESKNGYHVYWEARDASHGNWKRIVRWGIVPALGADPKVSDPLRLLRAPGYHHTKDINDPFKVRIAWERPSLAYSEEQMLRAFPSREPGRQSAHNPADPHSENFWERVAALDCRTALLRLNGHWLVKGEHFELREQANGNANIYRKEPNGRLYSTGCFVDSAGRLGSVDDGSSLAAWVKWYGHSWAEVARGLKEAFPELGENDGKEEAPQGEDRLV